MLDKMASKKSGIPQETLLSYSRHALVAGRETKRSSVIQVVAGNESPVLLRDLPSTVVSSDVAAFLESYGYQAQRVMCVDEESSCNGTSLSPGPCRPPSGTP